MSLLGLGLPVGSFGSSGLPVVRWRSVRDRDGMVDMAASVAMFSTHLFAPWEDRQVRNSAQ